MGNEIQVGTSPDADMVQTSDDTATSLVRMAIERGVDVEILERLVALQERVTERNARAAYFAALAAFQNECPQIHKSRSVDYANSAGARTQYSYAPLEEIMRAIAPLLQKHGLSYSWTVEESKPGSLDVVCIVRHIDGHQEASRFPTPTTTNAKMSDAQKNGAALTYGRRQSLVSVLGIIASDDADGADPAEIEPISEFQARELEEKITKVGADRLRFLAFLGVDAIEKIPAGDYARAMKALDRKAAKTA